MPSRQLQVSGKSHQGGKAGGKDQYLGSKPISRLYELLITTGGKPISRLFELLITTGGWSADT